MRNLKKAITGLIVAGGILAITSCSTSKNVEYFQEAGIDTAEYVIQNPQQIKITPQDKLRITVTTQDQRLTDLFNLGTPSGLSISSGTNETAPGYTVDSKGDIDFPVLGEIHVAGLTREQVAQKIKSELESRDLVKDPVVSVEFANLTVSVMGEVTKPGKIKITKDKITLLDALAEAGDLTIFGQRDNVLVFRNIDGKQTAFRVNLKSAADVYNSPVYFLQQDDIVYVTPNKTKANQSELSANTVNNPTFWLSVTSVLTSVCVLIFR